MNCPVCSDKMKEVEKSGVALDICPGCKGVWLDRGELEKLMDYAASVGAPQAARPVPAPHPEHNRDFVQGERNDYRDAHKHRDHDDDDDHHNRKERHHDDDRYRGNESQHGQHGQQGQYPKKKSWASNIFDMIGLNWTR